MNHLIELIIARPGVLGFWVFVVGSAIGSFLNVVIYRLPRGMSLSKPGSHCPKCGHAIRWYHNLPIVGWLLLGGKCYDCKAAISPRYPLVELVVAVIFVGLAYFDVYLPAIDTNEVPPDSHVVITAIAFGAHAWLACSVLAGLLIRWDGMPVPWRLVTPAILVTAGAAPFLSSTGRWLLLGMAALLVVIAFVPSMKKPPAAAEG